LENIHVRGKNIEKDLGGKGRQNCLMYWHGSEWGPVTGFEDTAMNVWGCTETWNYLSISISRISVQRIQDTGNHAY
jgi:hypothetical protein